MRYTEKQLNDILDSTDHRCHICRRRLYLDEYGREWEVDRSRARAKGGTNSRRNLRPACIFLQSDQANSIC
jgi:hypothetical protein